MNEARIKLAEAMGWKYQKPYGTYSGPIYGKLPAGGGVWTKPDGSFTNRFNPFTDANDCDMLKQFMQSQGWVIDIDWQPLNENMGRASYCPAPAIYVEIWHSETEHHERFDTDRGEPYTVAATVCKCLGIPLPIPLPVEDSGND